MKPVVLDFSNPGAAWRRALLGLSPSPWPLLVLAGCAGCLGLALWNGIHTRQRLVAAQDSLQQWQQVQRRPARIGESRPALSAAQAAAWNQLARQLDTPWPRLLDALEQSTPEDTALVAIEPDARRGGIRLQAESRTLDALLLYASTLKAAGPFDDVVLVKHETNEQDVARPVRLSLDVRLKSGEGAR